LGPNFEGFSAGTLWARLKIKKRSKSGLNAVNNPSKKTEMLPAARA
jgi:hypothetical protein